MRLNPSIIPLLPSFRYLICGVGVLGIGIQLIAPSSAIAANLTTSGQQNMASLTTCAASPQCPLCPPGTNEPKPESTTGGA